MDIQFSSSCAAKALHEFMLHKDYKSAKRIVKDEAYYEGTFDEAWAEVMKQYSASSMKLVPVKADQVVGLEYPYDHADKRQYLIRIGSQVFVSTVHKLRGEGMNFYNSEAGGWIPVEKADEIMEIVLS